MSKEIRPWVSDLDDESRDLLAEIFGQVVQEKTADSELAPVQLREVEPIRTWLRSRYYNILAPNLFEYWMEEIADFIEGGYNEWVISGGIGTGKSTAAGVVVNRKIYELSCFEQPQRLFRLADLSKIFFAYLSTTIKQAELTGFGDIRNQIDNTPYFQERYPRDPKISSILRFPGDNVFFIPGSDQLSFIGTNLYGCILDEMNFLRTGGAGSVGNFGKAQKIYQEATDRRRSRFMYQGKDPGFSLLVSSSTVQTSFTDSRIRNAGPNTKVTQTKLWEVKPPGTYSDRKFFVFPGSEQEDAFVIERAEDLHELIECPVETQKLAHAASLLDMAGPEEISALLRIGAIPKHLSNVIVGVPTDFRESFDTDLYSALKNIAGVSVAPTGKLFSSRSIWSRACTNDLVSPFKRESFTLSMKGPDSILDYFRVDQVFQDGAPVRDPWAHRYLRVDQSKNTDSTGIACVHRSGWTEDKGVREPIIDVDFVIRIDPPPKPDRIGFHKIRSFILALRDLGMPFSSVSFDQYQSEDHQQLLEMAGFTTALISVDRTDKAYITVVNLLQELRIRMYDYGPLRKEFFNLDHDRAKGKVDHPEINSDGTKGSKDCADALVGAVFDLVEGIDRRGAATGEILQEVRTIGPTIHSRYEGSKNFDWLIPQGYRNAKGIEIEVEKVGASLGFGDGYSDDDE